ncbi:MAG: lytic transglycosylase domain-containing protein [Pseudomonadota bacterium]|nr:lytic transglycosylase domain-containing protein [Pseudomonadota bacterium]
MIDVRRTRRTVRQRAVAALAVTLAAAAIAAPPWAARPAQAQAALPTPAQASRLAPALDAMKRDDWGTALSLARTLGDPAAVDLVTWRMLSNDAGGWFDYAQFLKRNPDWPGARGLRRSAEERMPPDLPAAEVEAFFAGAAPQTGSGAVRLATVLGRAGRKAEALEQAVRAWTRLSLTPSEEQALLAGWGGELAKYHAERLDMLLWRGLSGESERMYPRVDAGMAALGRARLALRAGANGVDGLIAAVPARYADDAGLAYERFRWREKRGLDAGAEELILARSTSAAALGRPELWADERIDMVRAADRAGRARVAYILAARHFMKPDDGYDYADLEWLAGWIALRKLNDPAAAEAHFARFTAAVGSPISLGRGYYWLGRAREAKGDRSGAADAYREGARWQTSFYGQLAAERAGAPGDPTLAGLAPPTDWRAASVLQTSQVRAAVLLHYAGERGLSHRLLTNAAAEARNPRSQAALGQLALELDRPEVAVRVGKAAASDGAVLPTYYYPVMDLANASGPISPSLALSIARQESEMNPEAISHAGARGLMQLMPGTAKLVAKRLGIGYDLGALTRDWRYNARLGTDYLAGLVDEFGSLPMAAAGYNAGPNRVRQWIERYGDPRTGRVDMIDWIETIPFDETRNYVQRVMEGLHVYDARLSGKVGAPTLTARLARP